MTEKMAEFDLFESEFDYRKLPEISEIEGGGTPDTDTDEYWGGSIPWITPTDLSSNQGPVVYEGEDNITKMGLDEGPTRLLSKYSVILTARGTVGESAIMGKEASTNQSCYSLTEGEENPYYLYYGIQQMRPHLESLGVGGTFDSVTRSTLDHFKIPVPPRGEQERIASVLYTVDQHVEALDQRHSDLQNLKQALMQDLLTGQTRVTSEMTVHDEVEENPAEVCEKEWSKERLSDVAGVIMGNSPDSDHYNEKEDGKPFLQGNNEFGYRNPDPDRWCAVDEKIAEEGDIMVSIRAPVGDTNIADTDYVIGRGVAAVSSETLNHEFLYHLIEHKKPYLERISVGSTFDAITSREFNYVDVSVPPLWEQERIASVLYTVDEMIARTSELRDEYERLKRGLMQDLLSGEVRTSESVAVLEELESQTETQQQQTVET